MGQAGRLMRPRRPRPGVFADRNGTSAIEFALVAPFLAFSTVGMSDLSLGLARKYKIEQATYRTLEMVSVGTIQSDYAYVAPEAAAAAGEPAENVSVDNWLECDGTKQADFSGTCTSTQQVARFVKVTVVSDYEPFFNYGPLGAMFGGNEDGVVRLTARSTIRIQ
jgi:Flp pilus assembly protein TadG